MNPLHLIVLLVVIGAVAVLWISSVVSILRTEGRPSWVTALWVLATLVLPVLGPIVWFAAGRARRSAGAV